MPIIQDFEYVKPNTIKEAIGCLARYRGAARVLAGGTDLVGWLRDAAVKPKAIIDLKGINGWDKITYRDRTLKIGALVTFNQLIASRLVREKFPVLYEACRTVGSAGIRNRATLAGNICSAVPCCDSGPALLVYEAQVRVTGKNGSRIIPITRWFQGPRKTALKNDELMTEIVIRQPAGRHAGCYVKLGRYQGEDLAQAGVAILALPKNTYRIAFGAVAPRPLRGARVEELLKGKMLTAEVIQEAKHLAEEEISPITDIRASREYRTKMIAVMLERGLAAAVARFTGSGPAYGANLI